VTPDVVVDVGNTRIKWGLCSAGRVEQFTALPADNPSRWNNQLSEWRLGGRVAWAVAGVHPARCDAFAAWARTRGDEPLVIHHWTQLGLIVKADPPERVGLDRLLNVLAAKARLPAGSPAVVVDAGTAVTVNLLDADGAFAGGAIFPGVRLMARSLHDHTAMLPLVEVAHPSPDVPGRATTPAIAAGVYWAAVGGINVLVRRLNLAYPDALPVFLTGGDAGLLDPAVAEPHVTVPELTLDGIRLASLTL
jgi:type III pantothenate kinase